METLSIPVSINRPCSYCHNRIRTLTKDSSWSLWLNKYERLISHFTLFGSLFAFLSGVFVFTHIHRRPLCQQHHSKWTERADRIIAVDIVLHWSNIALRYSMMS
jgi:hypothetical protein